MMEDTGDCDELVFLVSKERNQGEEYATRNPKHLTAIDIDIRVEKNKPQQAKSNPTNMFAEMAKLKKAQIVHGDKETFKE